MNRMSFMDDWMGRWMIRWDIRSFPFLYTIMHEIENEMAWHGVLYGVKVDEDESSSSLFALFFPLGFVFLLLALVLERSGKFEFCVASLLWFDLPYTISTTL
ncbi:hypothetical protein ACMFMG_001399 [Clarireedia jacksonii]